MIIPKRHSPYWCLAALLWLCAGMLAAQDCEPADCVWPGDANHNGIANNMDFLWMGMAYGFGGPAREEASFTWTPQAADDWPNSHPLNGLNYKYADTNGDGFVDGADFNTHPILYGQTNDQFTGLLGHELPGDDLFMTFSDPSPQAGQQVDIFIHLGSPAKPVTDLAGIAFTLELNTNYIKEEQTVVDPHGGWLGTPWVDLFNFGKVDELTGLNDPEFAFARINGEPVSGHGEIARVSIVIEDVIVGLDGQPVESIDLEFNFKRVLGLNFQEEDLQITAQAHPFSLLSPAHETEAPAEVRLVSRPGSLLVQSDRPCEAYSLIDPLGRMIRRQPAHTIELSIPTVGLSAGIYYLQLLIEGEVRSFPVYIDPG